MAYRKYDTCFFERYAAQCLQRVLGHKFDGLVNMDRPDLQSEDGKTLGIEVTRAMSGGKGGAQLLLKEMAGVHPVDRSEEMELEEIISNGYAYGLQRGRYVGTTEQAYWTLAKPLKEIIQSKVSKAMNGFYGSFKELGLFIFSQDSLSQQDVHKAARYVMDLQQDSDTRYERLFIADLDSLYACNLSRDISEEYRVSVHPISKELRKELYLSSLDLKHEQN